MKDLLSKIIVGAVALLVLSQSANAASGPGFYVVPKALIIVGDKTVHNGKNYDGDAGAGIGIDIGYALTSNFALEVALTYAEADVSHTYSGVTYNGDAEYTTYGVVVVYSRNIIGHLRGFAKFGHAYEYEVIKLAKNGFKDTVNGNIFAAGVEYKFADNMEVVFEVEHADVISTRGQGVMLGLKYIF
ncbi:MAG: porin family protein [Sulfurimonas sp.]|nr:porin family protein [Sulfurimonas sp.]